MGVMGGAVGGEGRADGGGWEEWSRAKAQRRKEGSDWRDFGGICGLASLREKSSGAY